MESGTGANANNQTPRRVMVVADPNRESAAALQYALSHAVVPTDELTLIHVTNPLQRKTTLALTSFFRRDQLHPAAAPPAPPCSSCGGGSASASETSSAAAVVEGGREADFLEVMKKACEAAQPRIRVAVQKVDPGTMDKAAAILFNAKVLSVDLLIIGQRRSISSAILGPRIRSTSLRGGRPSRPVDTAEYLIEYSPCNCVGVQKKGQNGGYLLNSKTHRNFWLLA